MPPPRLVAALALCAFPASWACGAGDEADADPGAEADTVERSSTVLPAVGPRVGSDAERTLHRKVSRWMKSGWAGIPDEDGDGRVSAGELARGVFDRWDTNGDRVLSRVEWRAGAERWFAAEVARGTWDEWDRDGDAALHPGEFRRAFERHRLVERVDRNRDDVVSEGELFAWHLEVFDTDGDGRVDPEERRAAIDAVPEPGLAIPR